MNRNLFPFLFVFSLVCCTLSAKTVVSANEQGQTSFVSFTGKIVGDKVRMRLSPNLEGHIVNELPKGDIYAIVTEQEDYYGLLPPKESKAYIYRTYVLDNKVEAEHVNVRLSPSTEAPIVAQLNSGDNVNVKLTPQHSKWYEISMPAGTVFWVAKEYVENIGSVDYVEKYHERVNEANQLLATADLIAQTEFRKKFQEVDLTRLLKNFDKIAKDYPDLEYVHEKASLRKAELEKEYCNCKIAFLEGKAGQSAMEVETLSAKLSNYNADEIEETTDPLTSMKEIQAASLVLDFPEKVTDKMKVWQPLEFARFQAWSTDHQELSLENFYGDERLNADELQGIVEPFNTLVKYKPGDFILTSNGQTVAYLYSTHVNLQDLVGKKVGLKVSERDNNNFAFPAYYVLEVQKK
ncbi:MAG: hypothetical protein S4CHLAM7_14290 [Chlamydiae bacterium]|nr:hypothetical protein [Chlamydiota bacterium]